jgi:hypothetical protein
MYEAKRQGRDRVNCASADNDANSSQAVNVE